MNTVTTTALAQSVSGEVVLPGDSGYERLSKSFVHRGEPALIVRCQSSEDVRQAVAFARQHGLVVSVRSGGHSNAGYSTNDGGLVIDLGPVNGVEVIDPRRHVLRLGPGAKWGEVAAVLTEHNLAISSGDTSSVGVGGLLVGGGIGWLVRKQGLAIDHLVAAEVVTADGQVLRASATENADLFWGIRGGGGNLGVVTSFEVAAQPAAGVFFGPISYPAAERAQVLKGWSRYLRTAPEELTSSVQLFPSFGEAELPPVNILACYAGTDPQAAQAAIDPLLRLGTLLGNEVQPMPYSQVLEEPQELPPGWQPWVRSAFAEVSSDELVDAVVTSAGPMPTLYVEFRSLGGAVRRVPADATAFGYRDCDVMVMAVHLGSPEDHVRVADEYNGFWQTIAPYVKGAYSGFLSEVGEAGTAGVFPPETYARLATLKRRYDPENVFSRNPNVPPALVG